MTKPYQRKPIIGKTEKMSKNPAIRIILALFIIIGLLRVIKSYPIMIPALAILAVIFYFRIKRKKESQNTENTAEKE